jgi:hypothetical protein
MKNKPYYRIKGKSKDGRKRVLIEWATDRWSVKSKALPKPEILLQILDGVIWTVPTRKKHAKITLELREPKVHSNSDN